MQLCDVPPRHSSSRMKFIHSADWQIGARFAQFGTLGPRLRAARLGTLRRALALARAEQVDGFLIAGDLFEDHGVEAAAVQEVHQLLAEAAPLPIYILPGNHDPAAGAGAIWHRAPFAQLPPHVRLFLEPAAVPLGEGVLLAAPLRQKKSPQDPSVALVAMRAAVPSGQIVVGMTHGSPAIGGMHQHDDFPIHTEAASRAGLDYLALGHWHRFLPLDGGRMVMPGTPEPTDFAEGEGAGSVCLVEIVGPGVPPKVTRRAVGELSWRLHEEDLTLTDDAPAALPWAGAPAQTLARVILRGTATPSVVAARRAHLAAALSGSLHAEVRDETVPALEAPELAALQQEHPLLKLVLEDLAALEEDSAGSGRVRKQLAEALGCAPEALTPELMQTARRMLLHEAREHCPVC